MSEMIWKYSKKKVKEIEKYEMLFENFKKEWEKARAFNDAHGVVIVLFDNMQVYTDYYERNGKYDEEIEFYEGNTVKGRVKLDDITGVKTVSEERLKWEEIREKE
ncbi:MAG: hypothetical protein QXL94_04300 [Candidatus Parvarchaeum sp.]